MSLVASLLSRIQSRKVAKATDAWAPYRSMLIALANGEEPNVDEAELILEDLGKAPEDIGFDVKAMRRRLEAAAVVARQPQVEIDLKRTEAEIARLQGELDAITHRLLPKIREKRNEQIALQGTLAAIDVEKNNLRQTVIDPVLLQRIESAQRILRERGAEEQELEARVTRQKAIVASAKAAVDDLEKKRLNCFIHGDKVNRAGVTEALPKEREYLQQVEQVLERLESELAELRAETQPARDELSRCEPLKLIP